MSLFWQGFADTEDMIRDKLTRPFLRSNVNLVRNDNAHEISYQGV